MSLSKEPGYETLATCHALIGHPTEPKFLAVRHEQGWGPPTVRFPPGPIDFRPAMINEGMSRKYGLATRILRPLFSSSLYHCLEMELLGRGPRRLEGTWVGRDEYERVRAAPGSLPDPFEKWFDERERGLRPAVRPAWEFPGWFGEASHWIQFQLDRLQLQATGSVEQFHVGSNAYCLLRVATGAGRICFKAAYARPPAEAALTVALARTWPQWIIAPLAVDAQRNWMLNRDFRERSQAPSTAAELVPFARAMAELQIASSANLPLLRELGCPLHDGTWLLAFVRDAARLQPWLEAGGGRLSREEITALGRALAQQSALIERLAGVAVPAALVHADFRPEHLVPHDAGPAFTDWSDCVIGHPFFVLDRMLAGVGDRRRAEGSRAWSPLPDDESAALRQAYLEPFTDQAPMPRLVEALDLARRLYPLWRFTRIGEDLAWMEPGSVRYQTWAVWLQVAARKLIRRAARDQVPAA